MTDVTLTQPRVRVVLESEDGETLTEYVVQTTNRDAVRYDIMRTRRQWPPTSEAPMLWMTFCAWSAMKHHGDTDLKVDDFLERCLEVQAIDHDGNPIKTEADMEAAMSAVPTRPAPGIDS